MRRWIILAGVAAFASLCLAIPNPTLPGQEAGTRKSSTAGNQSEPEPCPCQKARVNPKKTSSADRQTVLPDEATTADADREAIALASSSVLTDLYDPAFARFIDLRELGAAWATRDPATLTDVGLQLAEGERILLRPHKAMSASTILSLAARLAGESRDEASLTRLARAARQLGDKELAAVVKAAENQVRTSHNAPALLLSAESTSPDSLEVFQAYLGAIRDAKLTGDRQALEAIDKGMIKRRELNAEQRSYLKQFLTEARTAAPAKPDSRMETLNRLAESVDQPAESMDIERYRPPTYRPPSYHPPSHRPPTVYHPPVHPRPHPPVHPRPLPRPPLHPTPYHPPHTTVVRPRVPIIFPPSPRVPVIVEPRVIVPDEVVIVPERLPGLPHGWWTPS